MTKSFFMALSWVFLVPVGLTAQTVGATSVSAVVESVRSGQASTAADFLANKGGDVSGSDLSEFADSLVVIASSYRSGDPREALQAAGAALTVIGLAADPDRGTPFPRAFETLVRIYEGSPELPIRSTAIVVIGSLPSKGRAVQFLSEVAVLTDGLMPAFAVRTLAEEAGQPGLDELRRLYRTNAVSEPNADGILDAIAHRHGWGGGLSERAAVRDALRSLDRGDRMQPTSNNKKASGFGRLEAAFVPTGREQGEEQN